MASSYALHTILLLASYFCYGWALECYVCERQEGNVEKCLKTITTCEPEAQMCLTDIRWGSPPYWTQGSRKQFYVSKRCATKDECRRDKQSKLPYCNYVWYLDWKCSDCCSGDRCNYYVIMGGSFTKANKAVTFAGLTAALAAMLWQVL